MTNKLVLRISLASLALVGAIALGLQTAPAPEFLRLTKPATGPEVLQTGAQKFVSADGKGPVVWLVGAAHIGEKPYYAKLQNLLDAQDVVLYEGVTRKGVDPVKAPQPGTGSMYGLFADTLGLSQQLQSINYSGKNFLRSDLAWEDLEKLSAKQGPAGTEKLSMVAKALDPSSAEGKMLKQFLDGVKKDPGSIEALKLAMTEALSKASSIGAMLGAENEAVIVKSRNEKVVADLVALSGKPDAPKSVAIFYGAAHMTDLSNRLTTQLHYVPDEKRFYTAMSADPKKVSAQGQQLLVMFRNMFNALTAKGGVAAGKGN